MTYPPPNPAHALTADEIELAGLDPGLRDVGCGRLTLPYTESGQRYHTMGYWFAVGWWFAQPRDIFLPDRSSEFADYCRLRRDEYMAGGVTSLPSIPDMWKEFTDEPDPSVD